MYDFHMHSIFSDGKNSIEEMVAKALELKLKKIAITDHIWRTSKWFNEYCSQIITIDKKNTEIDILIGFEAKALSVKGEIDATEHMCKKADIKIGAIHRIPSGEEMNAYLSREEVNNDKIKAYNNWLETTKNMIINKNVDIIAHPCMVLDKYQIKVKSNDIVELFLLAQQYNKRLEISNRYKKSNIPILEILGKLPFIFNNISYGSDAHSIEDLRNAHNGK